MRCGRVGEACGWENQGGLFGGRSVALVLRDAEMFARLGGSISSSGTSTLGQRGHMFVPHGRQDKEPGEGVCCALCR